MVPHPASLALSAALLRYLLMIVLAGNDPDAALRDAPVLSAAVNIRDGRVSDFPKRE